MRPRSTIDVARNRFRRKRSLAAALTLMSVGSTACPATHHTEDAADTALGDRGDGPDSPNSRCPRSRSVTIAVVTNTDGASGWLDDVRVQLVIDLTERLLTGDIDVDGLEDTTPVEEVRLLATGNEICVATATPGAAFSVPPFCAVESAALRITATGEWLSEAECRLSNQAHDIPSCVPEPFDAAVMALSSRPGPEWLEHDPLGDTVNAAWRERDDVFVLVLEAADWRDDCSARFDREGTAAVCDRETEDAVCCEANLPPVSRTADALRAVVGERPTVFASLGQHPAFDPMTEPPTTLDTLLESGIPEECAPGPPTWTGRAHTRMVRLARALYPDMQLVPLSCVDEWSGDLPSVEALARQVFSRFCDEG